MKFTQPHEPRIRKLCLYVFTVALSVNVKSMGVSGLVAICESGFKVIVAGEK